MGPMPDSGQAPQPELEALSNDAMLVATECWRGADNTGTAYRLSRRTCPFSPRFITADADHHEDGMIRAFRKGCSVTDCVTIGTWTWDGKHLMHTSASTTGMCRQSAVGSAWDFPTLVTDVVRTL